MIAARSGLPLSAVWRPPAGMPDAGVVTEVTAPATAPGFAARPAWLYLLPAYLARPRAQLPVLMLLSGQPGDAPRLARLSAGSSPAIGRAYLPDLTPRRPARLFSGSAEPRPIPRGEQHTTAVPTALRRRLS